MPREKTFYRGREYQDVIHHSTNTVFSFMDRIKILFGKRVYIESEIYCNNEMVNVVGSEAKTFVSRWFVPKRSKGQGELMKSPVNMCNEPV